MATNGFVPHLLTHMKNVAGRNYAGMKITPAGFLKALIQSKPDVQVASVNGLKVDPLKLNLVEGQIREVKLKYLPRLTPNQISEDDNCEIDTGFNYNEVDIAAPRFAKVGIPLSWGYVERYAEEAAQKVDVAQPSFGVLREMEDLILHAVNGLVGKINNQLLTDITWGENVVTGSTALKIININKQSHILDLSTGIIEILNDTVLNEFAGTPLFVGSGLINNYELLKPSLGTSANGLNASALGGYKYYYDQYAATNGKLGGNVVGVFAPGTVGLVDLDRYVGWKTGRFGTSEFGTIMLPVETGIEGQPPVMMVFNIQVKEFDCPTEAFTGYSTETVDRGYHVFITKRYGLYQQPLEAFQTSDRLYGTNGALRYEITNVCDDCGNDSQG